MNFRFLSHPKSRLYYELAELVDLVEQIKLILHKIITKKGQECLIDVDLIRIYEYSFRAKEHSFVFEYAFFCSKLMEYINKQKACGVVMLEICEIEARVKEIPLQLLILKSLAPHFSFR
jgi:hypothetical protein